MKSLMLTAVLCAHVVLIHGQSSSPIWTDINEPPSLTKTISTVQERTVAIDFNQLKSYLEQAPSESQIDARSSSYIISLPDPEGNIVDFQLVESSIMEPALQAQFPEIRTFLGSGLGDYSGAYIRADFTAKGFHAQILLSGKTYYIDPYSNQSLNEYIVYSRESFFNSNQKQMPSCETEGSTVGLPEPDNHLNESNRYEGGLSFSRTTNGSQLRTYRLALACTGEYAAFHGGTTIGAMSAMTTSMNRVNGIYERDMAIRMVMVANNNLLIYLNGATDPYSNLDGFGMLSQNQTNCDAVIGSANYDVGHVFSTGGGGIASLDSPCNNATKARGVTGLGSPVGDPFDIDYVAHEFGHQWGANHTQNNSCQRVASAAYEPGSASTIMGYAGICSPNLQSNSDAHFHIHSIFEMYNFSVLGTGNSCAQITNTGNNPPSVDGIPVSGFHIPVGTPFELTGSASDANGDNLTYCWEQYDLGPVTAPGDANLTNPSGTAPIFRSFPPSNSPTRVFPRIADLVNNTTGIGEHLPTYTRELNFRLTVRDNNAGSGGIEDDLVTFTATSTAGPFLVTAPNTAVSWPGNTSQNVTWNVANTDAAPVNCSEVDIFLSTDGGLTYPTTLANNVANDGSQDVTIPNVNTSNARIKVKAANNIFFDISNTNFTITPSSEFALDAALIEIVEPTGTVCGSVFSPIVNVINQGTTQINSLMFQYSTNGSEFDYYNYLGDINTGESVNIELPAISIPEFELSLSVAITSVNGLDDENPDNNSTGTFQLANQQSGLELPVVNDFEGVFPGEGWSVNNPDDNITWVVSIVSANCTGANSAYMNHYNYDSPGQFDDLISPPIDLAGTFIPTTSFDVAYAPYNTTLFDGLQVDVRNICTSEWTTVYFKEGSDLETAPATTSGFSPSCDQWRTEMVDLSDFIDQVVEIRFRTINGFGNNLLLDNIQVTEEVVPCNNTTLFPSNIVPIDPNGALTEISDLSWSGDYSEISGIETGNTYELNMEGGGFLTVRTGTPDGEVLGFGNAPLQIQAEANDNFFVHWSDNLDCAEATVTRTTTAQCLTCAPCDNASIFGQWPPSTITVDPTGTLTNISTVQYPGGEYSTIDGIVTGETYQFDIASGGYATVREGAIDGPVIVYGPVPLEVTAMSDQNLFVHWNTDDLCGTSSAQLVLSTVECTSCGAVGNIMVSMDGISSNCGEVDAEVLLYVAGTNIVVSSSTQTIDSDGNFTIPEIALGSYDLYVKPDRYLRVAAFTLIVVPGENPVNFGSVVVGDIDGTSSAVDGFNQIGNGDLNLLFSAWETTVGSPSFNIRADLNCDDEVGNADLNLFFNEWEEVGVALPSDD